MSDTLAMAKTAREALARALSVLQTDATAPPDWMDVAEPVSEAMGALFRIERSQGAFAGEVTLALEQTRKALSLLQGRPQGIPAIDRALESVASALGQVHALHRVAQAPAPAPTHAPVPAPVAAPAASPAPAHPPAPIAAPAPPPYAPAPAPSPAAAPAAYAHTHSPAPAPAPSPAPAPPPYAHAPHIEVALAPNSPSNLYLGFGGDDIVDHGGVFVATYDLPKIGQSVSLHILLPGGYALDAHGVVHWTRETEGEGSERGYGVKLLQVSSEGRELLARYARNREPIFYDDV